MNIKKYETDHFDEIVEDLYQWSCSGELYLRCLKTHTHEIKSVDYKKTYEFLENQLYEIDDVVDLFGDIYFYLKECGDDLCVLLTSDNFEIAVRENV